MVEISLKVLWIVLELVFVDEMPVVGERLQEEVKNLIFGFDRYLLKAPQNRILNTF
jgi:hypothetical protein